MHLPNSLQLSRFPSLLKPLLVLVAALSLTGCEVIGDIFKAGFWTGIVIVAVVVAVVIFAIRMFR